MQAVRKFFFIIAMISCVSLAFTSESRGGIVIVFEEIAGNGVQVSWSGSGVVNTSNNAGTGGILDFNNFGGSPLGSGISGASGVGSIFSLSPTLQLSGTSSATNQPYTNSFTAIRLDNETGDDVDFTGSGITSLSNGDTYTASGLGVASGLSFSDLTPGSYSPATNSGDADEFTNDTMGVTLNIIALTAVPEPTSLVMFGGIIVPHALRRRRRRR